MLLCSSNLTTYSIYIGFHRLEKHHIPAIFVEPEHSGTEARLPCSTAILGYEELKEGCSHTQKTCLAAFLMQLVLPVSHTIASGFLCRHSPLNQCSYV